MTVEVKVPAVGESITEVYIGKWLKQEGDEVAKDEPLVELETDKATMEVHASVAGTLARLLKQPGDSATIGEVIACIEAGAAGQAGERDTGEQDTGDAGKATAKEAPRVADTALRVMPAAQRLLDEHGAFAGDVAATGPGGRLLKEDVQRHLSGQMDENTSAARARPAARTEAARPSAAGAAAAPARAGNREEELVPMSPLRRTIARRLVEAQQSSALTTTFNEIDMTEVMKLRNDYKDRFEKRYGVRLGFMSFFVKATIDALKQFPQLNAETREQLIVYKNYYDIAVAVSTPKGLVTPVLRNAERLGFADIETAIGDFGRRAQENKLGPDELSGGTFTISNGGVFGSLLSTPIVNPPQSGVLGMHAIQERPVARDGQVVIRPMMYVALTYDHRIIDGREAVIFLTRVKDAVEAPARMLLEI